MCEPYLSVVVLEELDFHSKQVNLMHFLQIVPDLMASPEAIELRVRPHELVLIFQGAVSPELLKVKLYLSIVGVLHKYRVGVGDVLMDRNWIVFRTRVHIFRGLSISFWVHFIAW
jgi:hypothetical protein